MAEVAIPFPTTGPSRTVADKKYKSIRMGEAYK